MNIDQLKETAQEFEKQVLEGLNEDDSRIKCLPAYIPSITLPDTGDSYVLDLGGTNVRSAVVSFEDGKCAVKKGPQETKMPWEKNKILDRNTYLETQSQVLQSLNFKKKAPLGYCFSFPAQSTVNGDARLIKWTKEIQVPGIEGEEVGNLLLKYLSKNYADVKCSKVVVINDTVASLIAGLTMPADAYIGLIAGTGTNTAAFIHSDNIPKLNNSGIKGLLPVNLESGNFHPPYLTKWDETVDRASRDTGMQRFEKAVSGAYLGNIFKAVYPESDFNEKTGAKGIAAILNQSEKDDPHIVTAARIYERSAKLIAASLAGLIKFLNSKNSVKTIRITAEGSLFWGKINGENRYLSTVQTTLQSLLDELNLKDIHFEFEHIKDANLIGSAIAALN